MSEKNKKYTVVRKGNNGDSDRENGLSVAARTKKNRRATNNDSSSGLCRRIVKAIRPSKNSSKKSKKVAARSESTIQKDEGSRVGGRKKKTKTKQRIYKPFTGANSDLKTISEDDEERDGDFQVMPSNNKIVDYNNGYWNEVKPKAMGNYTAVANENTYFLPPCPKPPPPPTTEDIAIFNTNQSEHIAQFKQVPFSAKNKRSRKVPDEDADFDEEQDDRGTARKRRKIAYWVCSSCQHSNNDDESCCTAPKCDVYRKVEVESASLWKVDYGNRWQCLICKVFNDDSLLQCAYKCGPKNTVATSSVGATNNSSSTTVVASTTDTDAHADAASAGSIGKNGFVFGMPTGNTTVVGAVKFSFGINDVAASESSSIVPTGELKYGIFGNSGWFKRS